MNFHVIDQKFTFIQQSASIAFGSEQYALASGAKPI